MVIVQLLLIGCDVGSVFISSVQSALPNSLTARGPDSRRQRHNLHCIIPIHPSIMFHDIQPKLSPIIDPCRPSRLAC